MVLSILHESPHLILIMVSTLLAKVTCRQTVVEKRQTKLLVLKSKTRKNFQPTPFKLRNLRSHGLEAEGIETMETDEDKYWKRITKLTCRKLKEREREMPAES